MREEGRERGDWVRREARSCGGGEGEIAWRGAAITIDTVLRSRSARRQDHDRCGAVIAIGAKARSRSVRCCDYQTRFKREREIEKERDRWRELRTRQRKLDGEILPLLTLPTLSSFSLSLPFRCVCESFFLSLFLLLRVCELLSLRVSVPEVIWR